MADRPQPSGIRGRGNLGRAEVRDLARDPGGRVHAVGDRTDRHLPGVETRPEAGEHLPADLAVQHGHAVDPLREAHAHDGHVEHVVVAARVGLRAEREHPLHRQPGPCGVSGEVPFDQLAREAVDARGYRSVRREYGARTGQLKRLVEREPGGHVLPDPL